MVDDIPTKKKSTQMATAMAAPSKGAQKRTLDALIESSPRKSLLILIFYYVDYVETRSLI